MAAPARRALSLYAPWLWGAGGAGWHVAALFITLPILGAAAPRELQLAAQPVLWGALSIGGVVAIARLVLGRLSTGLGPVALAAVGLAVASALQLSLYAWSMGRFGVFDADIIGPTAGLSALVVTSAVAGFAALGAPRGASWPPAIIAVLAALGSGIVAALNTGGLGDGLGPDSVSLALLVAAAGGYALLTAFVVALTVVRREIVLDER